MIRFESDYQEGAHESIIQQLMDTNYDQTSGYGEDRYCQEAKKLISDELGSNNQEIHFMVGGTQTNLILIAAALRPHQGVIAAESAHINTHETGAIEAVGHKILSQFSSDGKLTHMDIKNVYEEHWNDPTHEHIVQPALVYLSQPTECGTVYTLAELEQIHNCCVDLGLLLYIDGARLGYALAAQKLSPSLSDYARLTDAFYIGGTKVGALLGEALVITNNELKKDFRYIAKQNGGLLAKGRLLGLQFRTLFTDNLYVKISGHAVTQALRIRDAFISAGYEMFYDSITNQQFPVLPEETVKKLQKNYSFHIWQSLDNGFSVARFCTSWATPPAHVNELLNSIKSCSCQK